MLVIGGSRLSLLNGVFAAGREPDAAEIDRLAVPAAGFEGPVEESMGFRTVGTWTYLT